MENSAASADAQEGELFSLLSSYRRHLWLIGLVTAVVFALAVVVTLLMTPKYTAEATIVLIPQHAQVGTDTNVQELDPSGSFGVDTRVEQLKSRELAETVVRKLNLDHDPEFFKPLTGADAKAPNAAQKEFDNTVERVSKAFKAKRAGQTLLLELRFTSKEPHKAALIDNTFAEEFINSQIKEKADLTGDANHLLAAQLDQLRKQSDDDQAAVQKYRAEHNLLSSGGGSLGAEGMSTGGILGTTALSEQEIANLNGQYAGAAADAAEAQARLGAARAAIASQSNGADIGAALNSQVITSLRSEEATVQRNIDDLASRYGPRYPDLVAARQQLAGIQAAIQTEINRNLSNLEAQARITSQKADAIKGSLTSARSTLRTADLASADLVRLQSQATASQTLYSAVLSRVKETAAQQASAQSDARVNTRAMAPIKPSVPIVPLNLAAGLVLGLAAGVAAAVVRQGMTAGFTTMEEVESKLGAPYLAGISTVASSIKKPTSNDPMQAVINHPFSSFAESFRTLSTALLHGKDGPVRVVALTSALPNEGKTTTSVCLARVAALSGTRTVLVDCDLRRRSVNQLLVGQEVTRGLMEVLENKATLEEAIIVDEQTGLHILPLAKRGAIKGSPFDTSEMDDLLRDLASRYELVILDTAPILPVVDTRVLAAKVDAVAVLARWRVTPVHAVRTAMKLLDQVGGRVAGVALTRVDLKDQQRYGYGDPSYYHKDYKGYYVD
jgi:polysaccharide biosynthesis transport protein